LGGGSSVVPEFLTTDLLNVNMVEGVINFNNNRMLLLEAEALFQMREELIQTLGEDIARSVLTRFGHRSGIKDVGAFDNYFHFENDADWLLAGPKMHAMEGIVHSTCEILEYDRIKGTFYMTAIWRNSYEAEQHLMKHGRAKEPVCWTLTGYASGYASGFMGRQVVGVETMCQAMGDPYCKLELRSIEAWNGQDCRSINDLKQNMVLRSLQALLEEERERGTILQDLNKAIIDIGMSLESNSMPVKTVTYAQKLFNAEKAILAIVNGKTPKITLYETMNRQEVATKVFNKNNGIEKFMLESRNPVLWDNSEEVINTVSGKVKARNLISIPLYSKNELFGAIIVINKMNGKQFTRSDQELLALLAAQSAIALGNARIYEQTNHKLQKKMTELYRVNSLLSAEHDALQKAANIHGQLTSLVLEGHGLEMIARNLGIIVNRPVIIADQFFHIMSVYRDNTEPDLKDLWQNAVHNHLMRDKLSIFEGSQFDSEEKHIKICCNTGNINIFLVPIMAGKEHLGFVITSEKDRPLSQMECIAMEQAATVIALELLKQKAAFETERRIKKDFLDELLERSPGNEERTMIRAKQLGLDLSILFRVIAIEFAGEEPDEHRTEQQSDSINRTGSFCQALERIIKQVSVNLMLIGKKNNIICILSSSGGSKMDADRELREVAECLEKKFNITYPHCRWYIGIGSPCTGVANFSSSYQDACTTIEVIKSLKYSNKCKAYEQLGVFGLLNINLEQFKKFTNQIIGSLLEYDKKHSSQLINTLNLYYKNNCNLEKAARTGFMSSSTMKYRLRRIAEIADIDLSNPETNFIIQMALKIIEGL
jgi:DNA-binding PucR family transcriptional regulator/predicted hydrocarbon binding protein